MPAMIMQPPRQADLGGRTRSERGAGAVEFALIARVVLLMLFGIISYGCMLSFRQAISQAAAEGARAAALAQPTADRTRFAVILDSQPALNCATPKLVG